MFRFCFTGSSATSLGEWEVVIRKKSLWSMLRDMGRVADMKKHGLLGLECQLTLHISVRDGVCIESFLQAARSCRRREGWVENPNNEREAQVRKVVGATMKSSAPGKRFGECGSYG
eukprot:GFKZ01002877.1.p1 GENE.GFKZ01002877.1~~GFKZ01002877.1.p1  ORF type:complete len:116 (-),score=0.83 GFKZ01002877.1:135-482(-)